MMTEMRSERMLLVARKRTREEALVFLALRGTFTGSVSFAR